MVRLSQWTVKISSLLTSSEPATVLQCCASQNPPFFHFVIQPNFHVFISLVRLFVCRSIWNDSFLSHFTGATAGPSVFSYWGLFKDQHSIPVPFSMYVQDMEVLFVFFQTISWSVWCHVCGSTSRYVCSCHRIQSGSGTWCSEFVHSTRCYIPFVLFFLSVRIIDAQLSPSQTTASASSRLFVPSSRVLRFRRSKRFHAQVRTFRTNKCTVWRRLVPVLITAYLYCILFYGNYLGYIVFFI